MPVRYKKEILTVIVDDRVIGYIARRSHIRGYTSDIPDGWMITKSIVDPVWAGNFENKRLTRKALTGDA